jgi:hypothetical protein
LEGRAEFNVTCDDRKDLLLLYAGDLVEPTDREALRAHLLTGCPVCVGALAEAEATLAQMAAAVAPVAPPAGAIDKLMMRVGAGSAGAARDARVAPRSESRTESSITPNRRSPWLTSLLAAAAAVAITSGLWMYLTRDARSFWRSTNLATVAMSSPTQPNARGQVVWDRDSHQWKVTVSNLGPTAAGREYELWVIPAGGAPIRSQTFRVAGDGASTFVVPLPANIGPLATAAITDEPLGGVDAPTGKIHLAGEFR